MAVKLFTIISSLLLSVGLFFVISQRDLTFFTKDTKVAKKTAKDISIDTEEANLPLVEKKTPINEGKPPLDIQPPSATNSQPIPQIVPIGSIEKNVKQNTPIYNQLTKGTSDTDESYIPPVSPCTVAAGYKIGVFDTRFGISKTQFIEEINGASSLWENALNKKLFYYDPKASLTINLIYDVRQARTEDINNLTLEIENTKQTADALREKYEQEKKVYVEQGDQLNKDTLLFQERQKTYSEKVATYNANGGAQRSDYEVMMNELTALKADLKQLEERRTVLLTTMDAINAEVAKYNEFVIYINTLVKKSNDLGANKFTEGRFTPALNTIDIFQYDTTLKLRRVVAHELGHVLGINHNSNVYSIMYSMNTATTTFLSKEDMQALAKVCPSY